MAFVVEPFGDILRHYMIMYLWDTFFCLPSGDTFLFGSMWLLFGRHLS